jgi:hypothetical protein
MVQKVTNLAQQVAGSVSRRNFLAHLGRAASALAAVLGSFGIASPAAAAGGRRCCWYYHGVINAYTTECVGLNRACPGYPSYQTIVRNCRECRADTI